MRESVSLPIKVDCGTQSGWASKENGLDWRLGLATNLSAGGCTVAFTGAPETQFSQTVNVETIGPNTVIQPPSRSIRTSWWQPWRNGDLRHAIIIIQV
jgi:hypothetical protein